MAKSILVFAVLVATALLLGPQGPDQVSAHPPLLSTPTPTSGTMTLLHFDLDTLNDKVAGESPTVSTSVSPAATNVTTVITAFADTEIIQGYPAANCADSLYMRAGYDDYLDPDGQIVRSLVRFSLASIPPGATVYSASLKLYLSNSYDYPGHIVPITPHRISAAWAVDTVTWNSAPSFAESYPTTWINHGPVGWYSFDVTDLVKMWADGTYPNYGIMLRGPETSGGWREFTTSETIYPPQLIVEYEYEPGFDLTIVPDLQSVSVGHSSSSAVYVTATGDFGDSVTLDVGGLPAGVTYAWGTNPLAPTADTVLTITTAATTPPGTYPLTITGTAGSQVRTVQATLQILGPDFGLSLAPSLRSVWVGESALYTAYLTATGGFTDSVTLDVGGLPANTTHQWSANPVTPTTSTVLTITTSADTPLGTHTLTVTGTAQSLVHAAQATLQVSGPDFDLSLVPPLRSVSAEDSALYTAYLTATGGFSDSVTLDVGGLPANTTHQWSANPVTPTASTVLTITTTADTPTGTHVITVVGAGGGVVHDAQAILRISAGTVYLPVVLKSYPASAVSSSEGKNGSAHHVQQDVDTADTPVSRIALVVGISDYKYMEPATGTRAGVPGYDPTFPTNDAYDTGDILMTAGAFGSENVTSLSDAQATKAAIHAAIVNRLDPLEGEDTVVVILLSGHGMYGPDNDGDENDPYDEFFVPYEIEWDPIEGWRYEMAISDDELESWLSVLESQYIVILIDSCFSGGMIETSSQEVNKTRGLSWQPAVQEEMTAAQWRDGFAQDIQGPGRVVLTASAEDQPSWEFGELKNGAFTYYLVEALRSPSADTNSNGWISAQEAYAYLDSRVDAYVQAHTDPPENQNPQISDGVGGEVDLTQLGGTIEPCPSWD